MKTLIISIIILSVSSTGTEISHFYSDTRHSLNECPVQEPFDWVAVDLFLTSTQHQQNREKAGIENLKKQDVEFKTILSNYLDGDPRTKEEVTKYWNALGEYWQRKGITPVTNPQICQKINDKLSSEIFVQRYDESHIRRAYYQINDKYIILHRSTERDTRPKPALILDKHLNILTSFGI
jgi:hypothetical protein